MLTVGDIVPTAALSAEDGSPRDLLADDLAGNYTILLLCGDMSDERVMAELEFFGKARDAVAAAGGLVFPVFQEPFAHAGLVCRDLGLPFSPVVDRSKALFDAFSAAGVALTTVVVRPNNHVMAIFGAAVADHAAAVLKTLAEDAENRAPRSMSRHPPVLVVPDVLSRKDCDHLISVFNFQGNVWIDPGHGTPDVTEDYKMKVPDYGREDRIDHRIVKQETADFVTDRLRARLFPEIEKAFHYKITRFERYRIGSYKGERRGHEHGHRDDSHESVAHRRFAMSINLNSESFEGGALRFPEYGGQLYRPETGAAIVFSSSILHEAMQVTKGQRLVLLAFLFGDH